MAFPALIFALSLAAAVQRPASDRGTAPSAAPEAPPTARYCLRVDPVVGSRMETIRCETRADWAALDVDVDKEWAMWGVRVVTGMPGYGG